MLSSKHMDLGQDFRIEEIEKNDLKSICDVNM